MSEELLQPTSNTSNHQRPSTTWTLLPAHGMRLLAINIFALIHRLEITPCVSDSQQQTRGKQDKPRHQHNSRPAFSSHNISEINSDDTTATDSNNQQQQAKQDKNNQQQKPQHQGR
jgi:hypothetical protein